MQTDPRPIGARIRVRLPAEKPGYQHAQVDVESMNLDRQELGDAAFEGLLGAVNDAVRLLEDELRKHDVFQMP